MDAKSVVLIIADISGYTEFMLSHEKSQAHSQMIVGELLGLLVEEIKPPLELVELEGDAVFMYAPKQDLEGPWPATKKVIGEQLLRLTEVFTQKVRELQAYSICLCEACANIERLTLKTIVHSGEVIFSKIGPFSRLSGVDVITVHRLLKNSVEEDQYILMTESGYADVQFPEPLDTRESEEVYDVGSIRTYVALPPTLEGSVEDFIRDHETIIVLEINRDGQLYGILRRELPAELIGRMHSAAFSDGMPPRARHYAELIKDVLLEVNQ